jgi:hypothetical protein
MAQPGQSGCLFIGKHADHVPPGLSSSLMSQQTDDKPDVDNYSDEANLRMFFATFECPREKLHQRCEHVFDATSLLKPAS